MGLKRYLNQRMYAILTRGEHLHFEVLTLILHHLYTSQETYRINPLRIGVW